MLNQIVSINDTSFSFAVSGIDSRIFTLISNRAEQLIDPHSLSEAEAFLTKRNAPALWCY